MGHFFILGVKNKMNIFSKKPTTAKDQVKILQQREMLVVDSVHAMEFLDKISPKYPELTITKHNTSTRTGVNYYIYYKKKLNFDGNGVPVAVFGDKYEMGFGTEETTGKKYYYKFSIS